MPRLKTVYRCGECGAHAPKWAGRCSGCGVWNALVEDVEEVGSGPLERSCGKADRPVPIAEVSTDGYEPRPTGLTEVDRVLAGGLVRGSVTLVGGEPGIGKSTLLLQVASSMAADGACVLYVSAEESKQQVRLRAERLGALRPRLWLVADTALPHIISHIEKVRPDVVVVDSVQAIVDPEVSSAAGSVAQVRACAARLVVETKTREITTVLVGHVTKEGTLAGPRVLEHVVDTVLAFDGDRHHTLRLLRAVKHRFGSTAELGVLEMTEGGLDPVADASALFLADRRPGVAGSAVVPTLEGVRPMLAEVQALVSRARGVPARAAQGIDGGRLGVVLAVLEQRAGLSVNDFDVHALAVGGLRVTDPAADLGVALAVASSRLDRPIPADVAVFGELGLGGEVRQVAHMSRRVAEAARVGFTTVVGPPMVTEQPGADLVGVTTLNEALAAVGLLRS